MENSFDKLIDNNTLKWLPWVGDNYYSVPAEQRLLILGESHYYENTKESIDKHNSVGFTKRAIQEFAINRDYYQIKIFANLHRVLFRNDSFKTHKFWNLVSFYNFIQRPMLTKQGRPTVEDFRNGWKSFFEVITLLKPRNCLFIGTTSIYTLSEMIQNTSFSIVDQKWEPKIGNTQPKSVIIKDMENNQINLIFIRHTSKMFSWSRWNDYLMKVIPIQLNWLEDNINQNN